MSFLSRENSIFGGRPITLYEFQRGTQRWSYTSADRDQEFQTRTFTKIAITDDGLHRTGEASADTLTVRVPYNNPIALMFRGAPPAAEVFLTIYDLHQGESDYRVGWTGSIQGVRYPSPARAEVLCLSQGATMDRPGLWLGWERACPYDVYGPIVAGVGCGVSPALYAVEATVLSMTTSAISSGTFDAQPDGYFDGGYVEWPIGGGETERRGIVRHVGSELTLLGGTDGIDVGQGITAFPGCPKTIDVCDSRFGNSEQHGGVPHLPGKSPFDGDPIFW